MSENALPVTAALAFLQIAAADYKPLTRAEVVDLTAMQAGAPWSDQIIPALWECIAIYERLRELGKRPFDPASLPDAERDAYWDNGDLGAAPSNVADNWQQYAKEGETAQACIERHRAEQDSLMRLLAQARAVTCTAHDVLAERQRQVDVEGWTPEHDDEHDDGSMAAAAAAYALAGHPAVGLASAEKLWEAAGWDTSWFRPKDIRRNLVRAGALILAEIDRLDRAAARQGLTT
jgi:hypothetical protein